MIFFYSKKNKNLPYSIRNIQKNPVVMAMPFTSKALCLNLDNAEI